ncbi:MAG: DUF1624 domain-containing protein, partial [Methanobacterium paludis]|nr:DUF1624 domain-containing protein [Methanobacterium paludis]
MNLEERFWEVDLLRGFAIVMMITYHMIYDLTYFGAYDFNIYSGFLWYFARITAFIFIFLVGVFLKLSYSRSEELHLYTRNRDLFLKYLKRGLKIFVLGLGITMVTWIFIRGD